MLFEGAFKHRVATAARGAGLSRNLAYGGVDIERQLGILSRRLAVLKQLAEEPVDVEELRSRERMLATVSRAFEAAGLQLLGRKVDPELHIDELARAYRELADREGASGADLNRLLDLLHLAQEWLGALATHYRNFDEFLAKTRPIIAGTCVGVGQTSLRVDSDSFDWVIIDEAARCTAGELSVAAQLGRRILLVGDHLQLRPMIDADMLRELKSSFPGVPEDVLVRSEFERAFGSSYGEQHRQVLSEQYRMAEPICDLVTSIFYSPHGVRLDTPAKREQNPIFCKPWPEPFNVTVSWLDTSSDPRAKESPDERRSHANEAEVAAAIAALDVLASEQELVTGLVASREEKPIGIICMYSRQRDAFERAIAQRPWENRFKRLLKVETVDSYQGKENTIVIVSLSRSNLAHQGGHVSISNRANVAFSRAKERLLIVGAAKFWVGLKEQDPIRRTLEWVRRREGSDGAAKVFDTIRLVGR
jgi:hypothetical protein